MERTIKSKVFQESLNQFKKEGKYENHIYKQGLSISLSKGCQFLKDYWEADWLFHSILRNQSNDSLMRFKFQIWRIERLKNRSHSLYCTDGNNKLLFCEQLLFCNLPADYFEIWILDQVALLPIEHKCV